MKRVLVFILFLGVVACAKIVMPTGGPKDTTPPQLDTLQSSPLMQTNFDGRKLEFKFDEFIVIENPMKELIISPPLKHLPEFVAKRRTAILTLNPEDTLRENTTYSIQFNDAIRDFTEGNIVKNMIAVFSTGDSIDSEELRVSVTDNMAGKPVEGVHVMLYEDTTDSVVYREKPYYAALTNTSGIAHLRYLRQGEYKIFALEDENLNLFYDLPTEKIGFLEKTIHVPIGRETLNIALFEAQQETELIDSHCEPYGKCRFIFNNPPTDYKITSEFSDALLSSYIHGDSIIVWRRQDLPGETEFFLDSLGRIKDTIRVKVSGFDSSRYNKRAFLSTKATPININPIRGGSIELLRPLYRITKDSIIAIDTTGKKRPFDVSQDSLNPMVLHVYMKNTGEYTLRFLPGTMEDIYGNILMDTINIPLVVGSVEELSNLVIEVEQLDSTSQYIFRLSDGKIVLEEEIIHGTRAETLKFPGMRASKYTITLITDENFNGKYDKGSYRTKQQPESSVIKEIQGMRPGWDFQETISPKPE